MLFPRRNDPFIEHVFTVYALLPENYRIFVY